MTVKTIKAEVVVETSLALLEREVLLPSTFWRDAAGDFRGKKNDTISIRLPAYSKARRNALRSGDARTRGSLAERKVDVTLTDRIYNDIEVTGEEFTLDILDFTKQVMSPILRSILIDLEDVCAEQMASATFATGHEVDLDTSNPLTSFIRARKLLNNANVPQSDRFLAVGSDIEEYVLLAQDFQNRAADLGDESAMRDASMGRLAGFKPFVSNALAPDESYAYHRTAFVLNSRAPMVPAGAPWGATMSEGGFAIRAVQVLDPTDIVNVLATETWVGTNVVTDFGHFDDNGKFVPGLDPNDPDEVLGDDDMFVRAVKIAPGS